MESICEVGGGISLINVTDLKLNMKWFKTNPGPMSSIHKMENLISLFVKDLFLIESFLFFLFGIFVKTLIGNIRAFLESLEKKPCYAKKAAIIRGGRRYGRGRFFYSIHALLLHFETE